MRETNNKRGRRLQNARLARGISQTRLGSMVGVSQRAISSYECGDNNPPTDVAIKLAQVLGIEWSDFVRIFSLDS